MLYNMKSSARSPSLSTRVWAFVAILVIAVIGLVLIWRQLPSDLNKSKLPPGVTPPSSSTSTAFVNPEGLTKTLCEVARGHWLDCGNPCHGKPGEFCIQVCEPQCLCGGIAGWQCPASTACTDWDPAPGVPDALGVCRKPKTPSVPTSTSRAIPAGMVCDEESHSICVNASYSNALLTNPITVTGTAVAFESQFSWKLENGYGKVIEQGNVMAQQPDVGIPGSFTIRQFYSALPPTATGTLVLYEASPRDGSPIHILKIPVKLQIKTQFTKIYFPTKNGAASGDCGEVTAVDTPIAATKFPIEATLQRLLTLSVPSQKLGLRSSIPQGVRLLSLNVDPGLAKVVFSRELDAGGSCRVSAIRAQIEQTLKQFSSIKKVEISVEGKTPEESLQP